MEEQILRPLGKEELGKEPKSKLEELEKNQLKKQNTKILAAGQEETRREVSKLKLFRNITFSSVLWFFLVLL